MFGVNLQATAVMEVFPLTRVGILLLIFHILKMAGIHLDLLLNSSTQFNHHRTLNEGTKSLIHLPAVLGNHF